MDYLQKYGYTPAEEAIASRIQAIAADRNAMASPEVLKKCFSLMDLTTLKSNDTVESVCKLVDKVTRLTQEYPSYPLPASICVYPNFATVVRDRRCSPELHVTTVASCFPSAQSFLEVKVQECVLAVRGGADEVDIVLALNAFLAEDYAAASREIEEMRAAIDAEAAKQGRKVVLKVILETGLLATPERIARASFLAMEAGADFIKTSTGKVEVNATPMAAYVMCECIKAFYAKTGRKVGFKAAGGISNDQDALLYYCIGASILGADWLNKDYFRFGVSRLGNSLMSAIEQKTVSFF
ncbi:deoxyribose-phosphate aldolase [Bacteroidales bacterium WCE2004]|jgi:deoxyribose-phosphate aldolase|nr:deoxyribose-phosphate aldolase [Bacteroidales bacterium]SKC55644.1 deoxyribose-phosphate aldolase [Bacteroidales bacterium WCE2004]